MTETCAPPDELRGVNGYHWVHYEIGTAFIAQWRASAGGGWTNGIAGVRYLAPVTDSHDVDALRVEIGRLKGIIRVNALRAGLTHEDVDAVIGGAT